MTASVGDSVCLKIGVTAHIDLSHADEASLARQVRELFLSLQKAFPDLPLVVLNPLAPGGDTLVARVALEMGARLEVPLPMPVESYERDFSTPQLLNEFRELSAQGKVFELPLLTGRSRDDIGRSTQARDLQYAQLGTYIAGHSHLLLALWDGEECQKPGGTGSVVHFQLHDEMVGLPQPHDTEHLLADKESDLIYHIHCPRTANTETRGHGRWISNVATYSGVALPERYRSAFTYMQEFSLDIARHRSAINESGASLIADARMQTDPGLQTIDHIYRSAD